MTILNDLFDGAIGPLDAHVATSGGAWARQVGAGYDEPLVLNGGGALSPTAGFSYQYVNSDPQSGPNDKISVEFGFNTSSNGRVILYGRIQGDDTCYYAAWESNSGAWGRLSAGRYVLAATGPSGMFTNVLLAAQAGGPDVYGYTAGNTLSLEFDGANITARLTGPFAQSPMVVTNVDSAIALPGRAAIHARNLALTRVYMTAAAVIPIPVAFTGTVPSQTVVVGGTFTLDLASYFTGNLTPRSFLVLSGALPAGVTQTGTSALFSGTVTTAGSGSFVVRATDSGANVAQTAAIGWVVSAPVGTVRLRDTFTGIAAPLLGHVADSGGAWSVKAGTTGDVTSALNGQNTLVVSPEFSPDYVHDLPQLTADDTITSVGGYYSGGNGRFWVLGRIQPDGSHYRASFEGTFLYLRYVDGAGTISALAAIQATIDVGVYAYGNWTVALEFAGSSITARAFGVGVNVDAGKPYNITATATDTRISLAGKVGIGGRSVHLASVSVTAPAAVPDTVAPVMSGAIAISAVTSTGFAISWPAATDNVAVKGYETSRDGGTTYVDSGIVLAATFTGLTPGTAYALRVRAYDAAGNRSLPLSASQSTSAPVAATGLTLTGPLITTVSLASGVFSIGANGTITGTVVVTPSDGAGGGSFTPATVSLTSAASSGAFTYMAASEGAKTISVTNGAGLANPTGLAVTAQLAPTKVLIGIAMTPAGELVIL